MVVGKWAMVQTTRQFGTRLILRTEEIFQPLLPNFPPSWRSFGLRVLLSDLLWPGDPVAVLAQFAERATAVVVVQVLAEVDVNPTERGNIRLVDSETEAVQEIFLDPVAEKRYHDALARHQESWHLAAKQTGAIMTTVVAEEILSDWRIGSVSCGGGT